jgi:hypothetical protein
MKETAPIDAQQRRRRARRSLIVLLAVLFVYLLGIGPVVYYDARFGLGRRTRRVLHLAYSPVDLVRGAWVGAPVDWYIGLWQRRAATDVERARANRRHPH